MTVLEQLSKIVKNFESTVEEIEKAIDDADWKDYRKQLAHRILIQLPALDQISKCLVTFQCGAYLKELKIKINVLDIVKNTEHNQEQARIWLPSDEIQFAKKYVEELLNDMSKFSKIITFSYSGHDTTKFPDISFDIRWEF